MKKITAIAIAALALMMPATANAQFNLSKAINAGAKAAKAITLTDKQMADYVKEYIDWMDKNNPVLPDDDPYTIRLNKLTEGLTEVDGLPLNFKVYNVVDVNAFACADGSVRVFAALMDIMTDDELRGVIGHEIGHVAHHDSKKAFKTALLTSALKDGVASTHGVAAALTDSPLGDLGEALVNARYSRKQENEADEYGYEFLKKNGKNPWAMALAFKKLQSLEGEHQGSRMNQLFASHPDTEARIAAMKKKAIKEGIPMPEGASID